MDVLVTDGRKPVSGLGVADFELRDNGLIQTAELVETTDVPLNVLFVLDSSASTEGSRHSDLVMATDALLTNLKSVDRAALTTFSHAVTPRVGLTTNLADIRAALSATPSVGRTSVVDAVYVALTATLAEPGRSLVVVYTDGADISSWLQPGEIVETTKRSNAVIYAVTPSGAPPATFLEELTDVTGGDVLRVASGAELRASFGRILQEFRSRYVVSYTPTGVPLGGFHRLDVRVKRRGLTVRARPGYIGVESAR